LNWLNTLQKLAHLQGASKIFPISMRIPFTRSTVVYSKAHWRCHFLQISNRATEMPFKECKIGPSSSGFLRFRSKSPVSNQASFGYQTNCNFPFQTSISFQYQAFRAWQIEKEEQRR
jgi:hypothetical protein